MQLCNGNKTKKIGLKVYADELQQQSSFTKKGLWYKFASYLAKVVDDSQEGLTPQYPYS